MRIGILFPVTHARNNMRVCGTVPICSGMKICMGELIFKVCVEFAIERCCTELSIAALRACVPALVRASQKNPRRPGREGRRSMEGAGREERHVRLEKQPSRVRRDGAMRTDCAAPEAMQRRDMSLRTASRQNRSTYIFHRSQFAQRWNAETISCGEPQRGEPMLTDMQGNTKTNPCTWSQLGGRCAGGRRRAGTGFEAGAHRGRAGRGGPSSARREDHPPRRHDASRWARRLGACW